MLPLARSYSLLLLISGVLSNCATTAPQQLPEMRTANAYARDGLYKEAIRSFKRVLQQKPRLFEARRNLGIVLVKVGDYKNAIRNLEQVAPSLANDFETNFYLGEAYRGNNDIAEAIYRYKLARKLRADEPRVLKALAWSYYKARNLRKGLEIVQRFRKRSPRESQAAIIEARILLKMDQLGGALAVIRDAKSYAPTSELPFFQSVEGDILAAQNDCVVAVRVYREALKRKPLLAGSLLGLGRCYLKHKKPDKAIMYVERALRIRPELVEGHLLLGKAYEKTDLAKSITHYRKFRKRAVKDPSLAGKLKFATKKLSRLKHKKRGQTKRH